MAAAEQIKNLIKFFGDGDDDRFYSVALQIAASEAKKGHTAVAQELKTLIEKAKKTREFQYLGLAVKLRCAPDFRKRLADSTIVQPSRL